MLAGLSRYQGQWSAQIPGQQGSPFQLPAIQPLNPPSMQQDPTAPFQGFDSGQALSKGSEFEIPPEMDALYKKYAAMYGVPLEELRAIGYMESRHGRDRSVSSAGAAGPMQLMPVTAQEVGVTNRMDPEQSVRGAAQYYAKMRKMFGGNPAHALAAYNAGPGRMKNWLAGVGKPLAQETVNYMRMAPRWAQMYRSY